MSAVLVLNASYEPLHFVDLRHAVRMLVREVAVVEEAEPGASIGHLPRPRVLRLVRYVVTKWMHRGNPPAWTRRRVLQRDGFACVYCEGRASTIDHVLPVSRGGTSCWENTVAACGDCNQRKSNRTPREAGMVLRVAPAAPGWWQLVRPASA